MDFFRDIRRLRVTCNVISGSLCQQEKSANCGTKAADVVANFLPAKFNANALIYFGAFATTMTSQRLSIQSVAQFATVWP